MSFVGGGVGVDEFGSTTEPAPDPLATASSATLGRFDTAEPRGRNRQSRFAIAHVVIGSVVVLGLVLAAYFAPLPYNPVTPHPLYTLSPPSLRFWFGTDIAGFDVFSRTIAAARTDIPIGFAGALLGFLVGTPIGLFTSHINVRTGLMMRLLDIFQSLPILLVAAVITAASNGSGVSVIIAIAMINVPLFVRIVRSEALSIRQRQYVEAVEAIGAPPRRVSIRHILPNLTSLVLAQLSLSIGIGVLAIAALSYLGVGIRPPTPSWGSMIQQGSQQLGDNDWWTVVPPAAALCITVLSFNSVADGLQHLLTHRRSH